MMDFLCSALIGMSSEPRIHITDPHCYEFHFELIPLDAKRITNLHMYYYKCKEI